jgi:hypothetical protein
MKRAPQVLKAEAITRHFDHLIAADAVTLAVSSGEVFGLCRPQRSRQDDGDQDADNLVATHLGYGACRRFDIMREPASVRRESPSTQSACGTYPIILPARRIFLVNPASRGALVLGKALSAGIRSLSQAVIIYALASLLGVQMNWHPAALLGVLVTVSASSEPTENHR